VIGANAILGEILVMRQSKDTFSPGSSAKNGGETAFGYVLGVNGLLSRADEAIFFRSRPSCTASRSSLPQSTSALPHVSVNTISAGPIARDSPRVPR